MQSVRGQHDDQLKVWEKLRIVVGEGNQAGIYEARIEDFINGGIIITAPEFQGGHSLMRNGAAVVVQITREDAAYQFNSEVRQQAKKIILTPPRRLHRIQRRQFARVEYSSRVTAAHIRPDQDWEDYRDKLTWHNGFTVDVSAGGVQTSGDCGLPKGALALLRLSLFAEAGLDENVFGVCRRQYVHEGKHRCGIQFLLVHELKEFFPSSDLKRIPGELLRFESNAQDRLVNFLFQKQIELRQKGLI